jgi:hypothetical protein
MLGRDMRWWREESNDAHQPLCQTVRQIRERQSDRTMGLTRAARLFGDMPQLGLTPGSFTRPAAPYARLSLNIVRALCTTARADLVQGPPPRPMFVTSGGDWEMQQRAEGLTKFVAGVIYQTKFDATARRAALHSCVFGDGVVKVYAEHEKVKVELVFPWELWVDEQDGHYGEPRTLYQTKWVDKAVLAELYPDEREAIRDTKASSPDTEGDPNHNALADQILVVEAWHLPSGPEAKDGRHVIAIEGTTLLDEEWEDDSFPFVRFSWSEPLAGYWAAGIADEVAGIQYSINKHLIKIETALDLCANPRVWIEKGSKVVPAHLTNEIGNVVFYIGRKPEFEAPRVVSPEMVAQVDRLWSKGFQITGVSETGAAAMRPAGLQSGRAIRVNAELQSKRFVNWGKAFQDFYLEVSAQIVRLMRRLAKDNPSVEVVYHDEKKRHIERIEWGKVELDEDAYVLQAFPVSSLPSTPAGKLAALEELMNAGLIDQKTFRRLADFPDLEAEQNLSDAPRDLLEQAFERMLYGDGEYFPPEEFYDLELCMRVGVLHYQRAKLVGVPEDRLDLVRQFLAETQAIMANAASANAPPPGAGPPMPPQPPGPEGPPIPPEAMPPMMPPMAA